MTEAKPGLSAVPVTARPRLARHVRMSFDATRDAHVLLHPETVVLLNPTGADILGRCDGAHTVAEIIEELRGRYAQLAEDEVTGFLARLVGKRWVEIVDG